MKAFIYTWHKVISFCFILISSTYLIGQTDSTVHSATINRVPIDTSIKKMNMDAVYNRPFLSLNKMPVAIGGYLEANSIRSSTDGVSEGLSFQVPRLTIFMASTINKRLSFLTEIEFEEGGREINIEFAALDVRINSALNLRGGIIMNPIGAYNQNHDGPKWEFIQRPNTATDLIGTTLSSAGFGIHGKFFKRSWIIGYEGYLSNGFDDKIIDNELNRTSLPASKENTERFDESNNGQPLYNAKIAIKNRKFGEIGFSYMGGIYNKFQEDGVVLDDKRGMQVFAIDINTTINKTGTYLVGEIDFVHVEVPDTYSQQYGSNQRGMYFDIVQPILKKKVMDWENAILNVAARFDYVDYNVGTFNETGETIGDNLYAITPAISFRPSAQTVFRLNYRYEWRHDLFGNPPSKTASWLIGFSTYF
jgi:hypothetical protein